MWYQCFVRSPLNIMQVYAVLNKISNFPPSYLIRFCMAVFLCDSDQCFAQASKQETELAELRNLDLSQSMFSKTLTHQSVFWAVNQLITIQFSQLHKLIHWKLQKILKRSIEMDTPVSGVFERKTEVEILATICLFAFICERMMSLSISAIDKHNCHLIDFKQIKI